MDTEQPDEPLWVPDASPAVADERTDTGIIAPGFAQPSARDREDDRFGDGPQAERGGGSISRFQLFGVIAFGVLSFFFFLAMKLPEARIQNLLIAHLRIVAQQQGFSFSAEKVRIGLLLGPSLKLYNVELKSLDDERQSLKIPYLKISPRLLSIVSSVKKVGVAAELLGGGISGYAGASSTGSVALDLSFDTIDLGAATLARSYLPIELSAKIDGQVALNLDSTQVQSSDGLIKLKLEKVAIPPQTISSGALNGIRLPKIGISEININVSIANGQISIKELTVGKEGSSDDLIGKLTGDGMLNRALDRSTINAKAVFSLSNDLKKAFPFVEMVLSSAKQPDGHYAYRIAGPLSNLEPTPGQ